MIYYDITKMGAAKHRSGLMRVTSRLQQELGSYAKAVSWDAASRGFVSGKARGAVNFTAEDWLLTVELFSEGERPGFSDFVMSQVCRTAAIFHDAIPLRWPHITWPQSVQRHPGYMKLLASFERVFAISEASRRDLISFWAWQGTVPRATVELIDLGADFDGGPRVRRDARVARGRAAFLCVGIVEPRKNQAFLLDVVQSLWADGLDFDLHVVGRVNPHFGKPLAKRMQQLREKEPRFFFHEAASDAELSHLYGSARAVVFPTIAEGCGLPLLEALWRGAPCLCSDLPVLRENADGGGCLTAKVNDATEWRGQLRALLTDSDLNLRLQTEAIARPLSRWTQTAQVLVKSLR